MYQTAVKRSFRAQHFLIGGDFGDENHPHFHDYELEVILEGPQLNNHGYLVDIDDIKAAMATSLARYEGKMLNDTEAFSGLNPSIEHFSRIIAQEIMEASLLEGVSKIRVNVAEDKEAYSSYTAEL